MNRYENSMPRAALMFAAVAMTLLTVCLTVVAPAKLDSGGFEARVLNLITPSSGERLLWAPVARLMRQGGW